jgi:type I restriction enzyme, S subunit
MKAGWQIKTLGEILQKTETTNPIQAPEDEFEYIDVSSVSNVTFQIEDTQHLLGKDAPSRARKLVRTNDVLFATIRPTLRRIAVVPEYLDKQVCSTGYFVLRPKLGIDHRFMFYWLFSEGFMGQMEILQKGASYPAVTDAEVRAQSIPFPPLPEQQRIVTILDEAFDGIATAKANAEKNLQNARALFESHLQSVFTQRGEGWVEKTFEEVCHKITDGTHHSPQTQFSERTPGRFPYITSKNIRNNYMDLSKVAYIERAFHDEVYARCQPCLGDVLLTKDGANTGNVTLNTIDEPFSLLSSVCLIKTNHSLLKPAFLCFFIQSSVGLSSIVGQMTGAAIKRIVLRDIKKAVIPFPPLKEQDSIVTTLNLLHEETQRLESIYQQKLAAFEALKKSLLDQAFTGQL